MSVVRQIDFNNVLGFEFGFSIIGKPFKSSYVYIIDDILIDTAQRRMQKEFSTMVAPLPIQRVLLTHHHEDHGGNAAYIKGKKKIPIYAHEKAIGKMKNGFPIFLYQHYCFQAIDKVTVEPLPDKIESDHYCLTPIHTPGHSEDHTVFFEKNMGWLFSGDMFLSSHPKYFRADEKIDQEIESLKKIIQYDFDVLYCGHNPKKQNGKIFLEKKIDYLENLYGEIKKLYLLGYDKKEILQKLNGREVHFIKWSTFGNISYDLIVSLVINSLHEGSTSQ